MDFNCGDLVRIKSQKELLEILASRGREAEYQSKKLYADQYRTVRYKLEGGGLVLEDLLDAVWDADMFAGAWYYRTPIEARELLSNGTLLVTPKGNCVGYDTRRGKFFVKQYLSEDDFRLQTLYQEAL